MNEITAFHLTIEVQKQEGGIFETKNQKGHALIPGSRVNYCNLYFFA